MTDVELWFSCCNTWNHSTVQNMFPNHIYLYKCLNRSWQEITNNGRYIINPNRYINIVWTWFIATIISISQKYFWGVCSKCRQIKESFPDLKKRPVNESFMADNSRLWEIVRRICDVHEEACFSQKCWFLKWNGMEKKGYFTHSWFWASPSFVLLWYSQESSVSARGTISVFFASLIRVELL